MNASSQLAPPPQTPHHSSSPSPFDELDHWSTSAPPSQPVDHFDLFGTHDGATSTSASKANPFNAKYDPFADIWAEDEDHHFWQGEPTLLQTVRALRLEANHMKAG